MPAGAVTLNDISSADWSLMLDYSSPTGAFGSGIGNVVQGTADIDQCINIILTTPKGSDPFRPTFACDLWKYIDYPVDLAIPAIVREVTDAITEWEPRVTLISVTAELAVNVSVSPAALPVYVVTPGGSGGGSFDDTPDVDDAPDWDTAGGSGGGGSIISGSGGGNNQAIANMIVTILWQINLSVPASVADVQTQTTVFSVPVGGFGA